jgi:hypothetical protein
MHQKAGALQRRTETPEERSARLGPVAMRGFFNIARLWRLTLTEQQKLLALSRATLAGYRACTDDARLSPDTLERISYILGIYAALQILLPRPALADGWVRRPNTAALFGGQCALERMMSGRVEDLSAVRRYLDSQCAW